MHTLQRWRQLFLGKPEVVLIEPQLTAGLAEPQSTVNLGSITTKAYGGYMGLPQEVVDCIVDMLQDDRKALEACSLLAKRCSPRPDI